MQKLLIVEDDEKLRNELEIFLSNNGYNTQVLYNFENTVRELLNIKCDLILLDINLPYNDGKYILKELRKSSDVPVIMLTSSSSEIDELISLNYGADDYVTKPFNIQILLAKIAAILKRVNKKDVDSNVIDCTDFVLNISESRIEKEDKKIELTKNELKILHCLIKNRGSIVSREKIMEYLWNTDEFVDDNTLTVNITRVRNKLNLIEKKELIETRRGQGYILR